MIMNQMLHKRIRKLMGFLIFFLSMHDVHAQATGPQVVSFFSNADDTEQPYGLYVPKNFDPAKRYPLVVMLHGAGSNHRLALRRVFGKSNSAGENDVEATRYFPQWADVDFIVATPYARGTAGYQGIPEKDVYDVLADVQRRFSIDTNRIYLTGLSMGGGGSLWLALSRPDIWAAVAPVCPAPPRGTEVLAPNALNYPMWFFQGSADPVVRPEGVREWVSNLKTLGTRVAYTEYPGVQHDSWVNAYRDGAVFKWFDTIRRNPWPDRVRFVSSQHKYNKAYWVTLDALTPGTPARIDAVFTGNNAIEIKTDSLDGFTLRLSGHPRYRAGQPLQLTIDGKKIKISKTGTISLSRARNQWNEGVLETSPMTKRKGMEGPIFDAFGARHIYVYGTRDNPSLEERTARMNIAVQAANWSVYRGEFLGRMLFFPRVVSDREIRPSDSSAHLVLFGTKETNSIIQQHADILPLHLDSSARDHGLLYIFPANERYLAISSGLPWWTGMGTGFSFGPSAQSLLSDFKDYVLFKGSVKNRVAEGYFNAQWKLPAAAGPLLMPAVSNK